jgi:hypothetical protein
VILFLIINKKEKKMFKEVEIEQKELLMEVEKRLDEIRPVEITDFDIADEMGEEYNYLMDYLNSIKKISSEINELVKNILKEYKQLGENLLHQQYCLRRG